MLIFPQNLTPLLHGSTPQTKKKKKKLSLQLFHGFPHSFLQIWIFTSLILCLIPNVSIASGQLLPLVKFPQPLLVLHLYGSKHFESAAGGIFNHRSGVKSTAGDGVVTQRKGFAIHFFHRGSCLAGDVNYRIIHVEVEEDGFLLRRNRRQEGVIGKQRFDRWRSGSAVEVDGGSASNGGGAVSLIEEREKERETCVRREGERVC